MNWQWLLNDILKLFKWYSNERKAVGSGHVRKDRAHRFFVRVVFVLFETRRFCKVERFVFPDLYVDESVSFSMLPFSIYRSLRVDMAGNPIDLNNAEKGKTALTEIGKKHIMGVQGQLFAETIRSFDGVEYLLFPKILGLAERGWNAHPAWENLSDIREEQAFNQALALYYEKISKSEMPYWAKNGINFRLPQPGLLVKDGNLYANVAIDGAEVRYTTDGSEPTAQSTLWKEPVKCGSLVVKAKTFYQGKESLTIILNVE